MPLVHDGNSGAKANANTALAALIAAANFSAASAHLCRYPRLRTSGLWNKFVSHFYFHADNFLSFSLSSGVALFTFLRLNAANSFVPVDRIVGISSLDLFVR